MVKIHTIPAMLVVPGVGNLAHILTMRIIWRDIPEEVMEVMDIQEIQTIRPKAKERPQGPGDQQRAHYIPAEEAEAVNSVTTPEESVGPGEAELAEVEYLEPPIREMAQLILEVGPAGPDTTVQRKGLGDPELCC